jgi:hypothetical protein
MAACRPGKEFKQTMMTTTPDGRRMSRHRIIKLTRWAQIKGGNSSEARPSISIHSTLGYIYISCTFKHSLTEYLHTKFSFFSSNIHIFHKVCKLVHYSNKGFTWIHLSEWVKLAFKKCISQRSSQLNFHTLKWVTYHTTSSQLDFHTSDGIP